jgi:hypothetical protein
MRLQLFLKSLFILLLFADNLFAQPTFKSKDNRLESFEAVKEMKYGGILIVRLKTNYVKIKNSGDLR